MVFEGREATTRPSNATENGHEAKSNIHEAPVSQVKLYITHFFLPMLFFVNIYFIQIAR